jgi:WhiB family redox-sensing transcriptional regulator
MTVHTDWGKDAACLDADPDLFFPIGTTGPALRQIEEAKRICRICPEQIQCLAWALDNGVTDGVWGGTSEDERRVMRSLPAPETTGQEDDVLAERELWPPQMPRGASAGRGHDR